jgi:AcrR family transcriptional regulator
MLLLSLHISGWSNAILRSQVALVNIDCTAMICQMSPKRTYRMKKRADEMAETRRRITTAAVELHGTIGPARTTLSAVAERAGVQRHTVYRHFPDDEALLAACSAHYYAANPWPDIQAWRAIDDPRERLERGLDELYDYYERTEPMLVNVLRDAEVVDTVRASLAPLEELLSEAAQILAKGRSARGRRRHVLVAALRHALDFQTWRSLVAADRVTRSEAIELVTALVDVADASPRRANP